MRFEKPPFSVALARKKRTEFDPWDWLVVYAVRYEPVSAEDSLHIGVRSRHVAKRRIHPLARISLHMTVSEPQALEADRPR
jgi:hypothetical protein